MLGKTSLKYVSKLVCIVSSHCDTDFSCAGQNVSEKCLELIKNLNYVGNYFSGASSWHMT